MDTKDLSDAISAAQRALKSKDSTQFCAALERMMKLEPQRWLGLAARTRIIPDPDPTGRYSDTAIELMLDSVFDSIKSGTISGITNELMNVIRAFVEINSRLTAITERLPQLAFHHDSRSTRLYRLASFLESQNDVANRIQTEESKVNAFGIADVVDSRRASASIFKVAASDVKITGAACFEGHCAAIELVMREMFWREGNKDMGEVDATKTPYYDEDFTRLMYLAQEWGIYKNVWSDIVFQGWKYELYEEQITIVPSDFDDFVRRTVSYDREEQFLNEMIQHTMMHQHLLSDKPTAIDAAARTVQLPPAGQPWDGKIDLAQLRTCCAHTLAMSVHEWYFEERYYEPLVSNLEVGPTGKKVDWKTWKRVRDVLAVFARVLKKANDYRFPDGDDEGLNSVFVVEGDDLIRIVSQVAGISPMMARRATLTMIFSSERRNLEIWDQPLLPLSDERILLIPSVLGSAHLARCAEHAIEEWEPKHANKRSIVLEKELEKLFAAQPGAQAKRGIKFKTKGGENIECDVIVSWNNRIVLVEAKCLKSISSAADEFRAWEDVSYSVEQLQRRRSIVQSDWDSLRAAASELNLPDEPPNELQILCLAVPNIFRFTGITIDGVHIIDFTALSRFFGEQTVDAILYDDTGQIERRAVDCVRQNLLPTLDELANYVVDPPHHRSYRDAIKLVVNVIPSPGLGQAPLRVLYPERVAADPPASLGVAA